MDSRKLPHLSDAGMGVNRKLPHLGAGMGVNRKLPHLGAGMDRSAFIYEWFSALMDRMRNVRVAVGDWQRVLTDVVTVHHGLTGVFLDPPYTKGNMDYAVGGVGGEVASDVRAWCADKGNDPRLRIVLCGHAGEHDALLQYGWHTRSWKARNGYALTDEARNNTISETLWCSPHCVPEAYKQVGIFDVTQL